VTTGDARHFVVDPAYDASEQIGGKLYVDDDFDQGHVAAFADVSWGSTEEAARARTESCYYSNITPQLDSFNRSTLKGVWGGLEAEITKEADTEGERLSVFGGPVFAADDPPYKGAVVPRQFWKVVAYVESSALRAKGFILTQPPLDTALRGLVLADFQVYQHRIADIATEIELDLGALVAADTAPRPAAGEHRLLAPTPSGRPVRTRADVMADGW
jgi:endonuclease G